MENELGIFLGGDVFGLCRIDSFSRIETKERSADMEDCLLFNETKIKWCLERNEIDMGGE
jgi:hypothetical protein